jgi:predicted PurR-regulated permease PerM
MTETGAGAERFHRAFLLILVVATSAAFLATIRGFLTALLLAAILAALCSPLQRRLARALRGRETAAAALTVLALVVGIVGPLVTFLTVVAAQAVDVSQAVGPWLAEHLEPSRGGAGLLAQIPLPDALEPYRSQLLAKAGELAGGVGSFLVALLATATRGTVQFVFLLFVALYATFFFLRDGAAVLERILYYMPLSADEEERMVLRFVSVSRATIKGTLVIGVAQGALAGGAFALAGIDGAAFWGTVMALLSIVPGVGTALVWIPAVVWLFAVGKVATAVLLALWCAVVVGAADNVLRPMLVGKDTQMPDLLILLSTLGGLVLYGALGIVIGPLVAALFVTVWDIYGVTFRDYLPAPPRIGPAREGG